MHQIKRSLRYRIADDIVALKPHVGGGGIEPFIGEIRGQNLPGGPNNP